MVKNEVRILDQLLTAGVAAVAGKLADAINNTPAFICDPVGSILGFKPDGPCTGPLFADGLFFTVARCHVYLLIPAAKGAGAAIATFSRIWSSTSDSNHPDFPPRVLVAIVFAFGPYCGSAPRHHLASHGFITGTDRSSKCFVLRVASVPCRARAMPSI